MYVDISEVRAVIGVTDTSVISDATITQAIQFAEDEIDRLTFTTYYPVEISGTATAGAATTITDSSKTWTTNAYAGYAVYIYSGTGKGQIREIVSNTATALTVATWATNPDATSKYIITYLNKQTLTIDGTGSYAILLQDYPIVQVDSLEIEGTAIDSDDYVVYSETGKIVLKNTASQTYFTQPIANLYPQEIEITYHWGVLPELKRGSISLNRVIKRATCLIAGLQCFTYQMGGTYDDLSTFSLPEFSGSIGQAYVNIKGVIDSLQKELEEFKKLYLGKYVYMV